MTVVTLLGSGTAAPTAERAQASILVESHGMKLLLDAGAGAVRRLVEHGHGIEDLDALLITHFHPDHTADLVPIFWALRNPRLRRAGRTLRVYGPPGLAALTAVLSAAWLGKLDPIDGAYEVIERKKRFRRQSAVITPISTPHTRESQGYRIEFPDGVVLGYTGDTGPGEAAVEIGRGADLLVLECSFPDSQPVQGHLTPKSAAEVARSAAPKRLVLTHLYPEIDAEGDAAFDPVREAFPGELIPGRDGLRVIVSSD